MGLLRERGDTGRAVEHQTLHELIDGLASHGDRPAVVMPRRDAVDSWSFAGLAGHVAALAQGLVRDGVAKGETVALLANGSAEWIAACLAVIRAGAVAAPVDTQLGEDTLGHVLRDSGARLVFTTADRAQRLKRIDGAGALRPVLLDGDDGEQSWRRLLAGQGGGALPAVGPEEPAVLFYTSGTTGPPKGVPLSHANIAFQLDAVVNARLVARDDRVLLPLPLHHVYPFVVGLLAPLALGLPIILPGALTGPQITRALQVGEASMIVGVPRFYAALDEGLRTRLQAAGRIVGGLAGAGIAAAAWSRRRLGLPLGRAVFGPLRRRAAPRLRLLVSGGAALDPGLAWRLEGLGWQVASGYGLTETSPMLTWNLPGEAKLDTAGRPVPGIALRIAAIGKDEAGEPLTSGQGEIQARGPGVFAGYHNLPDKTAEAFTDDGWFRTGDLGALDADCYLRITGRVSTLIVTAGGENLQPDAVEEAYQAHPAIREIGVLQAEGKLVAVIVPEAGLGRGKADAARQEVQDAVRRQSQRLPSYQRLADFAITGRPLARTRLGKLRRHLLKERFGQAKQAGEAGEAAAAGPIPLQDMAADDRTLLDNRAAQQIWEWLAARYRDRPLTPDTSPQVELGIDSMDWVNLTLEIQQRAGVDLSDAAIARIETVRDLLREVVEAAEGGEGAAGASPLDDPESRLSADQKRRLEPPGRARALLARGLHRLDRMVMRGLFRLRVEGAGRLPDGQAVYTPTHGSYLDPFVVAAALDRRRLERTYWGGSAEIAFGNPLNRAVSRLAQAVPVDAKASPLANVALAAAVLKRGHSLVWFPEGQRSRQPAVQDFKPGIGMLLERFPAPVVPVAIHGAHEAYPPGRRLPRPGRVTVVFGDPLNPARLDREGAGERTAERITAALQRHVRALYERTRPARPPATGAPAAAPPARSA